MEKATVIKIGGSLLQAEKFPDLIRGLARYLRGHPGLVVHGGGKEITALGEKLGLETRFLNGRRFTDDAMMEVVEMVLAGKVNPSIVDRLRELKVPALGLSGRNARLVTAKPVPGLGRVGLPSDVRAADIKKLLAGKQIPVFASIASDGKGGALNVNADEMASALAMALKARRLILFTDVPGVLDNAGKTIPHITAAESEDLISDGTISGGMIPKIRSSFEALKKGVREIWILAGALPLGQTRGTLLSLKATNAKHPFA